jgi:choline kinase
MDVLILAAGLGSRLTNYTHNIIPKYLININNNTGLYYIINYWNNYANNIYLVIHSNYNLITNFYIDNILSDYKDKIKIIHYDNIDGTAYTINYILNNNLNNITCKNLLITWCDLYLKEKINFINLPKEKNNTQVYVLTYGNECRYILNENNKIELCSKGKGNILGIYYIQNYKKFILNDDCKGDDIINYLSKIGSIVNLPINNIVDYGDNEKLLKIYSNININDLKCRYFNSLTILEDKILKKGINDKGKFIIKNEISWYSYINNLNYIPKIYKIYEFGYLMEYKKNYVPLYKYLSNIHTDNINIKKKILNIIIKNIKNLHNIEKKKENKITFLNNLKKEIYDKVYYRKKIINDLLCFIGPIIIVNNIIIDTFEDVVNKCKNIIIQYYDTLNNFEYKIIHGDLNFSNILIDPENINNIVFIDPRGYFGDSKIFGPIEYDYSKILYGLSGYDNFSNNIFNLINFDKENKSIEFKIEGFYLPKSFINKNFNKVHKAFVVIIWLSLAEYIKNDIWKCIASYYYGLYLGTLL